MMNKYQEAFDLLYYFLDKTILYKRLAKYNARKQLDILEELVKKATPKKPTKTVYDLGISKQEVFTCCCGQNVGDKLICWSYCPYCGQAIDWSEDE